MASLPNRSVKQMHQSIFGNEIQRPNRHAAVTCFELVIETLLFNIAVACQAFRINTEARPFTTLLRNRLSQ